MQAVVILDVTALRVKPPDHSGKLLGVLCHILNLQMHYVEEIVKIINMAATKLEPTALAGNLSHGIFEITAQLQHQPTDLAIEFIKNEIRVELK